MRCGTFTPMARKYILPLAIGATVVAVAVTAPAKAYPPGTALDVKVASPIVTSRTFVATVSNIKPGATCNVLFNKKRTACTVGDGGTSKDVTLATPVVRGRFKLVASVPSDGLDGRSDTLLIHVASIKASALSRVGRAQGFGVRFLPEDTKVSVVVDGEEIASAFADADGRIDAADLQWTPDMTGATPVTLKADGATIWSKTYKVAKAR